LSSKKDAKTIWLDEGLKILETKGPAMLSIDGLALRTGKTKGAFYHHFNSHENYIKSLLAHYENISTLEIYRITSGGKSPHESLKLLTSLTFQLSGGLELAVRAWALYNPVVRRFQDRLDWMRIEYMKKLHMDSGMDEDAARTRSYRDYSLYIGLMQMRHHFKNDEFHTLLKNIFTK